MSAQALAQAGYHDKPWLDRLLQQRLDFSYQFTNAFHPYCQELIQKLTGESLPAMLDPGFLKGLEEKEKDFFARFYNVEFAGLQSSPAKFDLSIGGHYTSYNWELFYHAPLAVAVHLSKNQRFAEAQRWFHYVFDPTCNDTSVPRKQRCWKFLGFRDPGPQQTLEQVIRLLSIPADQLSTADQEAQNEVLTGYTMLLSSPFQPHVVARTRQVAYQYYAVMKYLDNLIAWGDYLFQQDTLESINEATQLYVLAANVLGEPPQKIPEFTKKPAKNFKQLREQGIDRIGNALAELQGQFPLNLAIPNPGKADDRASYGNVLLGIGRALYFCIPRNDKLLGYWDTVADRLFKIRHCMNIAGVVRPLALFDPPIDPGLLVKAAAAGLDISSVVAGLNQPPGPARALLLIQKALELCNEVRGMGNAVLAALEKGDAEHLALVRQRHEIQLQQMSQEVRFLQWKSAEEATTSLLASRKSVLERLHFYKRLLGLTADPNAPDDLELNRGELTEENFDAAYVALVERYGQPLSLQSFVALPSASASSPAVLGGFSGDGKVFLTSNEDAELNIHLPAARDLRLVASAANFLASGFVPVPDNKVHAHWWGVGTSLTTSGGQKLATAARIAAEIAQVGATWEQDQAAMAGRYAGYERRADEWLLQHNLAAHELEQLGRQILTSLIGEQVAHHEYLTVKQQAENALEINQFLQDKFTNEDLQLWMQGESSRLHYECYRFALDTARKAERAMKRELMRPKVDAQDFVQFNYWDGGRKGLLSGEALYLDVKRMELAYYENNKRELELTKHVSLRQLDPLALLRLKSSGSCQVTLPEWLFDLDYPGHFMRRIKYVALTIPAVAGPYTGVNCTLSLLGSRLRKSPLLKDGEYGWQGADDDRFVDYSGVVESIVTSSAQNDSGLFETNLRDERVLPFEGQGGQSIWRLDIPKDYPAVDLASVTDIILHIRYTARQGVIAAKVVKYLDELFEEANQAGLALVYSLRHDFPGEWSEFVNGSGNKPFAVTIRRDDFPYFAQGKKVALLTAGADGRDSAIQLFGTDVSKHRKVGEQAGWDATSDDLADPAKRAAVIAIEPDPSVLPRTADNAFLIVRYNVLRA